MVLAIEPGTGLGAGEAVGKEPGWLLGEAAEKTCFFFFFSFLNSSPVERHFISIQINNTR